VGPVNERASQVGKGNAKGDAELEAESLQEEALAAQARYARQPTDSQVVADYAERLGSLAEELVEQGELTLGAQHAHQAVEVLCSFMEAVAYDERCMRTLLAATGLGSEIAMARGHHGEAEQQLTQVEDLGRELLAVNPDDPAVRSGVAWAREHIGNVRLLEADLDAAERACEGAVALRRQLVDDHPDDGATRIGLAGALQIAADVARAKYDAQQALPPYREAVQLARTAAGRSADDPSRLHALVMPLHACADVLLAAGQLDETATALDEAATLLDQLEASGNDPGALTRHWSAVAYRRGELAAARGDTTTAGDAFDRALSLARDVVAHAPEEWDARRNLAITLGRVADLADDRGCVAEAIEAQDEVVRIARTLAENTPDGVQTALELMLALQKWATIAVDAGRVDDACDAAREAVRLARRLCELASSDPRTVADLWGVLDVSSQCALAAGDLVSAADAAAEARDLASAHVTDDHADVEAAEDVARLDHRLDDLAARLPEGVDPRAISQSNAVWDYFQLLMEDGERAWEDGRDQEGTSCFVEAGDLLAEQLEAGANAGRELRELAEDFTGLMRSMALQMLLVDPQLGRQCLRVERRLRKLRRRGLLDRLRGS
jgi:tetratricopeptide (TPR) repeat protein